jgi:hypothetical protein
MSLGRLHAKAAVLDESMVYIGSMNLDPRSESTNTELGIFVRCPELARDVTRAIDMSRLHSSYLVAFGPDGQSLDGDSWASNPRRFLRRSRTSLRSWNSATCCSRRSCLSNSYRPRSELMDNYLLLKSLHVLGVVIFLGNIIVTAVWKALADRTGSPAIVAYGIVNLVGIDAKSGRDGNDDVGLRDCRSADRRGRSSSLSHAFNFRGSP